MVEYPEELSRQARWGVTLGVVILLAGLLFGPSAPVSKDEFTQLRARVDEIDTNVKAAQVKVNSYESPLNDIRGKVNAIDPKVTALEQRTQEIVSLLEEAKAALESLAQQLSQSAEEHASALSDVQELLMSLEASFAEKFQVSVLLGDAPLDAAGKPACPQPYLAAQLLNESDVTLLREMGVDKNGDGIVCILPTLVVPIEFLQATSGGQSHD
jgi:archaellum component FlaC